MSGTGKAAVTAGGNSNANLEQTLADLNAETTSLDGTDVLDDGDDLDAGGDGSDGEEPKDGADEATDEEVSEDDKPMSAKEKRSLQLTIDRQGNELGLLRKVATALLRRANKVPGNGPTAQEWANNPDEAAKAEQESEAEMEAFESENRLIENRSRISEYVPNFDHIVSDLVKVLQEDGATPEYIAQFKKTPHAIDPMIAFQLAKRVEQAALIRRLQNKPAAKLDQRGFTPTNDKSGKAPAGVKGPLNYAAFEKLANDPAALDAALDSLSSKDQELLLEIGKRKARARR